MGSIHTPRHGLYIVSPFPFECRCPRFWACVSRVFHCKVSQSLADVYRTGISTSPLIFQVIPDVVALLSGTRGRANAAKTAGSGTCLQVNPNSRFGSTIGSRLKILNTLKIVVKLAYPKLNDEAVAAAQDIKFSLDFLDTGSSSKQPLAALESPDSLASTLSPILMDLWSESLPEAVFNGKNVVVNDSLRVCRAVLVLLRTLLALPDVTKETEILILEGFRAHVAPHFPFFAAVQASSSKPQRQRVGEVETVEAVLGEMDVSAALIYARFPDSRTSDGARIQEFLDDLLDSRAVPFIFPNSWIQGMRPGREKLELICMSRPFFWTVILSNGPGSEFIMERLVALFMALDVDALCMNQQIAKYVLFEFLSGLFDKVPSPASTLTFPGVLELGTTNVSESMVP